MTLQEERGSWRTRRRRLLRHGKVSHCRRSRLDLLLCCVDSRLPLAARHAPTSWPTGSSGPSLDEDAMSSWLVPTMPAVFRPEGRTCAFGVERCTIAKNSATCPASFSCGHEPGQCHGACHDGKRSSGEVWNDGGLFDDLIDGWIAALDSGTNSFSRYHRDFRAGICIRLRPGHRDLLPLPSVGVSDLVWSADVGMRRRMSVVTCVNACAAGLNFLWRGMKQSPVPAKITLLHRGCLERLQSRVLQHASRIDVVGRPVVLHGALLRLAKLGPASCLPKLDADLVDSLPECGLVDPGAYLGSTYEMLATDPDQLFPQGVAGVPRRATFRSGSALEFARLTVAQLRTGKVVLRRDVKCASETFFVHKSDGIRLREVWHGRLLTQAAPRPPKPPLLASPASLSGLQCSDDRKVHVSIRDGQCFFDQLLLPEKLVEYFGRPGLKASELEAGGATFAEIASWLGDGLPVESTSFLVPCCRTWPMGFGLSSWVSQSFNVDCIKDAYGSTSLLLHDECVVPMNPDRAMSVATDDVIDYTVGSAAEIASLGQNPLEPLDDVWRARKVITHRAKSMDLVTSARCLGVDLVDGLELLARAERVQDILEASAALLVSGRGSWREIAGLLGIIQWNDLLARPLLSVLSAVYTYSADDGSSDRRRLDDDALSEIAVASALFPLWGADLRRPWLDVIPASDASPAFGFGMAWAKSSPQEVRRIAARCAGGPHHVRVCRGLDSPAEVPRAGREVRLRQRERDFVTVFSVKADLITHAGALEATAAAMSLERLARCRRYHSSRGILLVDAQVVAHALAKGRSSAPTLIRQVRRAAAVQLAADFRFMFPYIASEDNPADKPSRGLRLRSKGTGKVRRKLSSLDKYVDRLRSAHRRLRRLGADSSYF